MSQTSRELELPSKRPERPACREVSRAYRVYGVYIIGFRVRGFRLPPDARNTRLQQPRKAESWDST